MKPLFVLVLAMILTVIAPKDVYSCSALFRPGPVPQMGKNYDWYVFHGHAAMFVNPRGVARKALALTPSDDFYPQPAHWISKLGNVTFTQFGVGLPLSGMNEAGLSVEILQLDETRYPRPRYDEPYFTETQWVQYVLDSYSSVRELLAGLEHLRILPAMVGAHYMVADASGDHAVIEFLDGRPVITSGAKFLTNDPYAVSARNEDPGWHKIVPRFLQGPSSVNRAQTLSTSSDGLTIQEALQAVRIDWGAVDALLYRTQWTLVHSMSTRHIEFRTRRGAAVFVALNDIDFSDLQTTLIYDVDSHLNTDWLTDVTRKAVPLTPAFNLQLLRKNRLLLGLAGKSKLLAQAQEFATSQAIARLP